MCEAAHAQMLIRVQPAIEEHFKLVGGVLLIAFLVFLILGKLTYRISKVFAKADLKKLDEYKQYVIKIGEQEKGLYEEYFRSLSHTDDR